MIPTLKQPVWHKLDDCLNRFPIKLTRDQVIQYLLDLKIIKYKYELHHRMEHYSIDVKTEYFNFGDYDYHVPYISENCLQMIINHIYKEIEQFHIIDYVEHLIELKKLGEATEEEIEKYKSMYKLS